MLLLHLPFQFAKKLSLEDSVDTGIEAEGLRLTDTTSALCRYRLSSDSRECQRRPLHARIAFKPFIYQRVCRLEHHVPLAVTEGGRMASASATINAGEYLENSGSQAAIQAFGQVLSDRMASLYRGAYRLLGNAADAEDAVQDALLSAYTHLDQFRGQAKMSTWLAAIVHNSAKMQLRRRLRHVHVSLEEYIGEDDEGSISQPLAHHWPNPEDACRDSELGNRMARFQSQLSPVLRKAYQLRHIDGRSIRETARILGVPNGTVKARTARARKKITDLMRRALKARPRKPTRALAPQGLTRS